MDCPPSPSNIHFLLQNRTLALFILKQSPSLHLCQPLSRISFSRCLGFLDLRDRLHLLQQPHLLLQPSSAASSLEVKLCRSSVLPRVIRTARALLLCFVSSVFGLRLLSFLDIDEDYIIGNY
ncbi:hypothetical protein Droror1_Dr00024309 [Drosera rotundifolia]